LKQEEFERLTHLHLLLSVEGIGPGKILNLLNKFKTPQNVFNTPWNLLKLTDGISDNLANKIKQAQKKLTEIQSATEKEIEKLDKLNGKIITICDDDYPKLLKTIYHPPIILYMLGTFENTDDFTIAIVGTRQPTSYGKTQTEKIAGELAQQNITIVSGMARGIDSTAHKAALKSGGRTIAVIGSGLDVIYPPENKKLFHEIIERGAVISEYELGTPPDAQNFPKRNRIISGLSLGTLIAETKLTGGAMQTAAFALDQNREVFAVPGNLGHKNSEGTNLLIQRGEAKLVIKPDDILLELELKLKPVVGKNIPEPTYDLNMFEQKILKILSGEQIQIDELANKCSISSSDCLVNLLSLEFKGLVKQLPGKMFIRN